MDIVGWIKGTDIEKDKERVRLLKQVSQQQFGHIDTTDEGRLIEKLQREKIGDRIHKKQRKRNEGVKEFVD